MTTTLPEAVRTAWHLVALSSHVRERKIQKVIVAGMPMALFRTSGNIVALIDRCPHRNYPLSEGRIVQDSLECPYHGWRFGLSGECLEVPGCILSSQNAVKLGAKSVHSIEAHGGIFVSLADERPPPPQLPPDIGDAALDHFWWQQGTWRGRAFDAIENVMDPFHTNHLHHGYIRRRDRRLPVRLHVNSYGNSIDMVIEQTQPDLGIMSRFLERDRSRSISRYYPPTVVQARWEGEKKLTLCVTAFFTPATDGTFTPFACFTTPRGLIPNRIKEAAIRLFLNPVVAQDRHALAKQSAVMKDFGFPHFKTGPGDILGNRLHRLWLGETIPEGADQPFEAQL